MGVLAPLLVFLFVCLCVSFYIFCGERRGRLRQFSSEGALKGVGRIGSNKRQRERKRGGNASWCNQK
jgi:hypothetical protein